MQAHPIPTQASRSRDAEAAILVLITDPASPGPWTIDELEREIGDGVETIDAIGQLRRDGLVRQMDDVIWPTRTAIAARRLNP